MTSMVKLTDCTVACYPDDNVLIFPATIALITVADILAPQFVKLFFYCEVHKCTVSTETMKLKDRPLCGTIASVAPLTWEVRMQASGI